MENSKIAWTDDTFNPWIGCTKVSQGCARCYAEHQTFARVQRSKGVETWGKDAARIKTSDAYWKKPLTWNREAEKSGQPRHVFCGSMCDVFEDRADLIQWRIELFGLIDKTPALTWLLLTKRPENIRAMMRHEAYKPNLWLGATVENQDVASKRLGYLIEVTAAVHFASIEPQIGPVNISRWLGNDKTLEPSHGVDWVICGGESGPNCRLFKTEWAESLRDQCKAAGVAFFMKQIGGYPDSRHELSDLPADLQIRQFPA